MRCVAVALMVCLPLLSQSPNDDLHELFENYYEDYLRENPEEATSVGRNEYNDRWRDWSRPARERWTERVTQYRAQLDNFEPNELNQQDGISWRLLRRQLDLELAGIDYDAYLIRVNQLFGLHTSVLQTMREMPARTVGDYENMIARLAAVPAYVDQNIAALREAIEMGITQPQRIADLVVGQLDAQAAPTAAESPLLAAFREFPAGVPEASREALLARAEDAYAKAFRPAWRRFRDFLSAEYLPKVRDFPAVTTLPDGKDIYRFYIGYHTTLPLTAREIHEIGRQEVERIDRAMEAIVREAGFEGTSAEYEKHLLSDPEYLFTDKESMLSYHRDLTMRVAPGLSRLFRTLPRHRVGIRAIPPDREAVSASNYNAPSADGTRPGWFNLKAYMPEKQSRFDKPALVLHETNPGHHLQIALQLEMEGLPQFRKIYRSTAYVEGWALYAESLGGELGVYDDPASRFGALESERFRARRLVVDTGLHAMGWTRQQAIDFLGDESEVDRYIAWPGQALAYKMGQLKITELKASACDAYGADFDVRDFHDAVLRNGPLPLEILQERVGDYISQASGESSGGCPGAQQ